MAFRALFVLLVALWMYRNVTNEHTAYGNGNGAFRDQVDSFSEYIIRNSVMNDLLGQENAGASLVMTRGYKVADYNYYPDGTRKYYSHQGSQRKVFTYLAGLFEINTQAQFERFFNLLRAANCTILAALFFAIFRSIFRNKPSAYLATLLMSLSGGAALFSSNLYFMYWMMFTPLFCTFILKKAGHAAYLASAVLFSFMYFSLRYEFASTFALLWLLPPLIAGAEDAAIGKRQLRLAGAAFIGVVAGFLLALANHFAFVSRELGVGFWEARSHIFSTLETRVASLEGVPIPLLAGFWGSYLSAQDWTGLSIPFLVVVKKFPLLLAWLFLGARELRKDLRSAYSLVFLVSIASYLSWYVVAYQHIMWHRQYDSLLFSVAIFLPFLIYCGLKAENILAPARQDTGAPAAGS